MYTKEYIQNIITLAVKQVTGKDIDDDTCLVDKEVAIFPADFIYIFEIIEEKLHLQISDIFKEKSYEVMIVSNLVDAISELKLKQGKWL